MAGRTHSTRFLTVDELIYINEQFSAAVKTYVQGKQRVRDMDLLEAAVQRPMQSVFGQDAYPTLEAKASALLHSIARNHPFADGNKRTATVGALFMLGVNGRRVVWDAGEALDHIIDMAAGRATVEDFAAWLPTAAAPSQLAPDADADTIAIARLIEAHAWLLDQLAAR